jgi:hypothetical protein
VTRDSLTAKALVKQGMRLLVLSPIIEKNFIQSCCIEINLNLKKSYFISYESFSSFFIIPTGVFKTTLNER